eukprot:scaffold21748_cov129-Isochrysis_galbana.AAC.7
MRYINGTKQDVSSIYLSAQPLARKEQLHIIRKAKILHEHAITGSDSSAASQPHSQAFTQSTLSRQSGMVQPVVQEMFAPVHAAGSSLFGLFSSCTTFDSTNHHHHRNEAASRVAHI